MLKLNRVESEHRYSHQQLYVTQKSIRKYLTRFYSRTGWTCLIFLDAPLWQILMQVTITTRKILIVVSEIILVFWSLDNYQYYHNEF